MATKPKKTQTAKKTTKKSTSKRTKSTSKKSTKATKAAKSGGSKPVTRTKASSTKQGGTTNGSGKKVRPARKTSSKTSSTTRSRRTTRPAKLGVTRKTGAVAPPPAPVPGPLTVTVPASEAPPPMDDEFRSSPPDPSVDSVRSFADDYAAGPPEGPSRQRSSRDSYLEDVPRDHAEVLAGFLKVVKAAAGDIRKLIAQAIVLSGNKRNRFDR